MDLFQFTHYYLNPRLEKLANGQKPVLLLGDLNVDLLKYWQHQVTNEFLDSLTSNMFSLPQLSKQVELLLTQRLSLIIYFPIISPKIKYQEI